MWRVGRDGTVEQLTRLPFESFPNGIVYRRGRLYVADSNLGVIRTLDADAATRPSIEDPRLLRTPGSPLPGANGLQEFHDELYVSGDRHPNIFAIEISPMAAPAGSGSTPTPDCRVTTSRWTSGGTCTAPAPSTR